MKCGNVTYFIQSSRYEGKSLFGFYTSGCSCQILSCSSLFFGHVAKAMFPHHALVRIKFGFVRSKSKIPTSSKWIRLLHLHLADAPQVWHTTAKIKKAARRPPSQDSCNYIQAVVAYLKFLITPKLLLRQRIVVWEAVARQNLLRHKAFQVGVIETVLQKLYQITDFLLGEV